MDPSERIAWLAGLLLALLFALAPRAHAYGVVPASGGGSVYGLSFNAGGPFVSATEWGAAWMAALTDCGGSSCVSKRAEVNIEGTWYPSTTADAAIGPHAGSGYSVRRCGQNQASVDYYGNSSAACSAANGWVTAYAYRGTFAGPSTCPSSSTLAGADCVCDDGYKPNGSACAPVNCAAAAALLDLMQGTLQVPTLSVTQCYDGCTVQGGVAMTGADGKHYIGGGITATGSYCGGTAGTGSTFGESGGSEPAPTACSAGTCPGTVNGASVCVACSGITAPGPSSAASGPSGAASSSSSTTCSGSSCTTTTTTTDSSGSTTTTTSTGAGVGGFCAENPGSAICQSAGWGGNCSAGFNCKGDAIQCAMAREQHQRNCALFDNVTAEVSEGLAHIAAGAASGVKYTQSEVDIGARFQAAEVNPFSSACPPDLPLGIGSLVVPLSSYCGTLEMLGRILVALTWLSAAAWLVSKGV